MMFKVKWKYDTNSKPESVYFVHKTDDGVTEFLMFKYGGWYWMDADNFEPCVEEET